MKGAEPGKETPDALALSDAGSATSPRFFADALVFRTAGFQPAS